MHRCVDFVNFLLRHCRDHGIFTSVCHLSSSSLLELVGGFYNLFTFPLGVHVLVLYIAICLQTSHMFAADYTITIPLLLTVSIPASTVILYHPAAAHVAVLQSKYCNSCGVKSLFFNDKYNFLVGKTYRKPYLSRPGMQNQNVQLVNRRI